MAGGHLDPGRRPIVLLTDFGDDYYVGVMKGVIATRAHGAPIIDLTHRIPPGDVAAASYVLASSARRFPESAVFCCVVDPGVGGVRRRIFAEDEAGRAYVAPDNGLLTGLLGLSPATKVFEIRRDPDAEVSRTFEGRDVFAPAAAHLANHGARGVRGARILDPVMLPPPRLSRADGAVTGEVVYVDRFGNLVTSIDAAALAAASGADERAAFGGLSVEVGGLRIDGIVGTYSEVAPSAPLAYVGSTGHLELGVNGGSAAARFGLGPGTVVRVARHSG